METRWTLEGGGELSCREEDGRLRFRALCPAAEDGLYKVWLLGGNGGRVLLGTLVPEGGGQTLTRTLFRGELIRAGCWPLTGARRAMAFSFQAGSDGWRPLKEGDVHTEDPVLRECLSRGEGLLFRRWGEGFQLAQPLGAGRPVALAPLFCLARAVREGERPLLVWSFDRRGWPVGDRH